MRRRWFALLAGLAALMTPILGLTAQETPALPPAEAMAVFTYMTKTNPFKEWRMWPGQMKFYPGTQPHGALLTTYVNETAEQSIRGHHEAHGLPDGSMIVKENYNPVKELVAVTAMYKRKGFAPESGDWFWIKWTPDGKIVSSGKIDGCIQCHQKAKDNDYLFTSSKVKK